jgi:hypothetical protein
MDLAKILYLVENNPVQVGQFNYQLRAQHQIIQQSFIDFEHQLTQLKIEIAKLIAIAEKPWFLESYRLYEEEMCNESTEYILNRRSVITSETEMTLRSRILSHASWQYPGMIIRPGLESFINDMVAYDPLYLVDQTHDLLKPAMSLFSEQYQQRLRPYVIEETLSQDILYKIPNDQLGMCLVYNFFNFRPFEMIRKYLIEIYQNLRPGGILILTFNDCDRSGAVQLVEQHFACYTPGYLVYELIRSIGYELMFTWNDGGPSTWVELKRPGNLTTLRGGQTLAKIVAKSK